MIRYLEALILIGPLAAGPALAAPDFLVDADWLSEQKEDPGLVILEVRFHPHRYFTVGHIPGAVQVQCMSLAWMQLRHLGYRDVRLYNGGWSHWGNSLTLPVVLGG